MWKYGLTLCNKILLNSKDNLQNILYFLQTALRFVFPPVAITPFFGLCSWYFLLVPRAGQALHNFPLSSSCFSALNLCPWQFAWETPPFSGFSLNVDSSERPCRPFSLVHSSPWAPFVTSASMLGIYFIVLTQSVVVLFVYLFTVLSAPLRYNLRWDRRSIFCLVHLYIHPASCLAHGQDQWVFGKWRKNKWTIINKFLFGTC